MKILHLKINFFTFTCIVAMHIFNNLWSSQSQKITDSCIPLRFIRNLSQYPIEFCIRKKAPVIIMPGDTYSINDRHDPIIFSIKTIDERILAYSMQETLGSHPRSLDLIKILDSQKPSSEQTITRGSYDGKCVGLLFKYPTRVGGEGYLAFQSEELSY